RSQPAARAAWPLQSTTPARASAWAALLERRLYGIGFSTESSQYWLDFIHEFIVVHGESAEPNVKEPEAQSGSGVLLVTCLLFRALKFGHVFELMFARHTPKTTGVLKRARKRRARNIESHSNLDPGRRIS